MQIVHLSEFLALIRELFIMARQDAPSNIFMDDIGSILSASMQSRTGNDDTKVQCTMLELLNQLDGFEASNKIKILMATNRTNILGQGLLKLRRIDQEIEFPNLNEEILMLP